MRDAMAPKLKTADSPAWTAEDQRVLEEMIARRDQALFSVPSDAVSRDGGVTWIHKDLAKQLQPSWVGQMDRGYDSTTAQGSGGMSDAAKRLRDEVTGLASEGDDCEWDLASMASGAPQVQMPMLPPMASSATMSSVNAAVVQGDGSEIVLPAGVDDLVKWGKTVCTLDKVCKHAVWMGKSYSELVHMSPSDKDLRSYLCWMQARFQKDYTGRPGEPQGVDLAGYLKSIGYKELMGDSGFKRITKD